MPAQNQIFVVRAIDRKADALCTHILFEFYEVPSPGRSGTLPAMEFRRLVTYNIVSVQISDIPCSMQENYVDWPQLDGKFPPPPLSIYLVESRTGFVHYAVWPVWVDVISNGHVRGGKETKSLFYYSLYTLLGQTSAMFTQKGTLGEVLILPGASRAIMYTIPYNTRKGFSVLKSLNAYISPDVGKELSKMDFLSIHPFPNPDKMSSLKLWPFEPKPHKGNSCKALPVPDKLKDELKFGGVTAIAWDESSGRLCMATKNLRELAVMEFGYARLEGTITVSFIYCSTNKTSFTSDEMDLDLTEWQDTPLAVNIVEECASSTTILLDNSEDAKM